MKCKLQNRHKLIADYLSGELSENEAKAFEEHYFQCETCFQELRVAEEAVYLVEKEGPAILRAGQPGWRESVRRFIRALTFGDLTTPVRWAVATAALAATLIALVILTSHNDKNSADLFGPNFEPLPYFEEWISEDTRSAGETLEVVMSPAIGEKFTDKGITFQWRMRENVPVTLKILTNVEEEVLTATPDPTQFPFYTVVVEPDTFTEAGLYYWRLEDEQDVLYVGKFYLLRR